MKTPRKILALALALALTLPVLSAGTVSAGALIAPEPVSPPQQHKTKVVPCYFTNSETFLALDKAGNLYLLGENFDKKLITSGVTDVLPSFYLKNGTLYNFNTRKKALGNVKNLYGDFLAKTSDGSFYYVDNNKPSVKKLTGIKDKVILALPLTESVAMLMTGLTDTSAYILTRKGELMYMKTASDGSADMFTVDAKGKMTKGDFEVLAMSMLGISADEIMSNIDISDIMGLMGGLQS